MQKRSLSATLRQSRFLIGLAFVVVVALAVRFSYLDATASGMLGNTDSSGYEALAHDLRTGRPYETGKYSGFGAFPAGLTRPPGYPALLAAISADPAKHQVRTAIVQIVLSVLIVVAVALLTAVVFSPLAGLAAGFIFAIDWTTIIHTPLSLADVPYSWAVAVAVLLAAVALRWERPSWWLLTLSGFLVAVACLIKPAAEFLIVGLSIFMLFAVRPRIRALAFILAAVLPLVPWVLRNQSVYGDATVSAIPTANLYWETALGTYAYRSPVSTDLTQLGVLQARAEIEWQQRHLTASQRSSDYRHLAMNRIEAKWPIVLDQAVMGLLRTAVGTGRDTVRSEWSGTPPSSIVTTYLPLLEVLSIWCLVALGGWVSWRRGLAPKRVIALLLFAIFLALLPAAEPGGYARFRVPAAPLMAVVAGVGLAAFGESIRRRPRMPRSAVA